MNSNSVMHSFAVIDFRGRQIPTEVRELLLPNKKIS